MLDDYYNLVNTLVHEDEHSTNLKGDAVFEHFEIGVVQVEHGIFEKATDSFKSFASETLGKYLGNQEKKLKDLKASGASKEEYEKYHSVYKANLK